MKTLATLGLAGMAAALWFGAAPSVRHFAATGNVEATIGSQVLVSGVSRFGMNLGGWSFWGADQFPSNILKNPGFEALIDAAVVITAHSGMGAFDDNPAWLARPDGFWEGARYSIRTGADSGKEGRVVHSSKKNYWGLPSFVAGNGDPTPNPGDVVALVKESVNDLPTQWWYSKDPGNSFAPETHQTRPGSPGVQALRVIARAGVPATLASYFDSIGPRAGKMLPLAGSWNLSFWARLDKGAAKLHVVFGREGSPSLLSRDVPLTASWENVQLTFSGDDNGPLGTVSLLFQVSGAPAGEVLLDDVDLRRTEDLNQPFRHEVVSVLSRLHPAYLRDWQGQLGDTLANRTAGQFARKPYRFRPGDNGQTDYPYGLRDFLDLSARLHASPWIIVPPAFNDADCAGLGDYLAAQRDLAAAREVLVEFGNENWNPDFRPGGIPDPRAHGEAADRCFAAIRKHSGRLPLKTVAGIQGDYPDGAIRFARQTSAADIVAVGPYFFYSLSAGLPFAARIPLLFQPSGNVRTIAAAVAPLHEELAIYEVNLHNILGNASAVERRPVVAGIASGAALARTMLDALALGVKRQCVWTLTGFEAQLKSQPGYVPLWGVARDVGPTQRLRPTGLALELINEALAGDMVSISLRGPKDVSAYAFKSSGSWSAVFVSSSASDRQVVFNLPDFSPGSTRLRLHELKSDTPEATNEEAEHIKIGREFISVKSGKASINLRPWSVAVLLPGAENSGNP